MGLPFRYKPLSADFFVKNRQTFMASMKAGTIAVFFSNDIIPVNADGHYRFSQDSNMYYLSGLDQEDCALVLFPDAPKPEWREILYVRKTSPEIQVWEGWKYSPQQASEASGIKTVRYIEELYPNLRAMVCYYEGVYIAYNEHERTVHHVQTAAHRLATHFRTHYPSHSLHRAVPLLYRQRMQKTPEEIQQLKTAIEITEKAYRRLLKFVRPGILEYEAEAEILHSFIASGASGMAFDPIIASGPNACVLHYTRNCMPCEDGHLLLTDFGAEYGNYSADLTRTFPVNGRFTPRQKAVYNAVLHVQRHAMKLLVVGNNLEDYTKAVCQIMEEQLLQLGLITQDDLKNQDPAQPAYKKFFPHGVSHHLGLDTHDVGFRFDPFKPGMVFTCEPGIYIQTEGIGIRLENDVLITEAGPVDLMANCPIEIEHIEDLMQS